MCIWCIIQQSIPTYEVDDVREYQHARLMTEFECVQLVKDWESGHITVYRNGEWILDTDVVDGMEILQVYARECQDAMEYSTQLANAN